jgi:predicted nucleic acid-binding Zn ribbon protein
VNRHAPRPLTSALTDLAGALAPASTLARIQEVWGQAAGDVIATAAHPVGERDGVLTLSCESSVWAHELELIAIELTRRINAQLGANLVRELRCRTS